MGAAARQAARRAKEVLEARPHTEGFDLHPFASRLHAKSPSERARQFAVPIEVVLDAHQAATPAGAECLQVIIGRDAGAVLQYGGSTAQGATVLGEQSPRVLTGEWPSRLELRQSEVG